MLTIFSQSTGVSAIQEKAETLEHLGEGVSLEVSGACEQPPTGRAHDGTLTT